MIELERGLAKEKEDGSFEFTVRLGKEDVGRFFTAFPGRTILLKVPVPAIKTAEKAKDNDRPEPQGITVDGLDSLALGRFTAPNADVIELCQNPQFQLYAIREFGMDESLVQDRVAVAAEQAIRASGRHSVSEITEGDYMVKLFTPFKEWLEGGMR